MKSEFQFYFEIKHLQPRLYFISIKCTAAKVLRNIYFKQNSHKYPSAAYHSTGSIFKCSNDNSEHTFYLQNSNSIFSFPQPPNHTAHDLKSEIQGIP